MFSFLDRELPATGRVFYRGVIPPPLAQLSALRTATCSTIQPAAGELWAIEATHREWGAAEIACLRTPRPLPDAIIDHTVALSDEERGRARLGESSVVVRMRTMNKNVLRDRKRLLYWLKALMDDEGVLAIDEISMLLWSQAMLQDEVAHDADLDIEALYTLHAIHDPADRERVAWLHTHGLETVGAFDFDILAPSQFFMANCADPTRAVAFAALEGKVTASTSAFDLAHPNGTVRFVPVDVFDQQASPEHRALRDTDDAHGGKRAVLCEPAGGIFNFRKTPRPSKFLSTIDNDGFVLPFSAAASDLMAERAQKTIGVFRSLFEEFDGLQLLAAVKLAYEVDGGAPDAREHLWFQVHGFTGDGIDATLANTPHKIASMTAGQRAVHRLDRLSDWTILSPEGAITPRNVGASRRLRANRTMWEAILAEAPKGEA
jgi:hypothetical protein